MPMPRPAHLGLAIALALGTLPAHAGEPTTAELLARIASLEQRLAALEGTGTAASDVDQRLHVVERHQELQAEAEAARAKSTPVVSLGEKGLSLKSADNAIEVKLRGLVQADGRVFLDDAQNDTFLFRRIRPSLEGSWGKLIGFRLTPDFAGDNASIADAYVDLKFDPRATVRIGKVKGPISLERLQPSSALAMVERGFPNELAPNRDLGVQLQGALANDTVDYVIGVYNGAADGRDSPTSNPDDDFEFAGRLFFEPWKHGVGALSGLGFGIAASSGEKHGSGNNFLPRYRSPGQVQFFGYRSDVFADGEHTRWSPQAYWYGGRFGLLGEYIVSRQEVASPAGRATLDNRAWQAVGSVVLSGEDASYRGVVKPSHPFTLDGEGWGAFEVVGRLGRLDIDDDAFPLFADPASAGVSARSWGLGLNWYLTGNLKLVANYTETEFDAASGATPREDEKAFFTRTQFSF